MDLEDGIKRIKGTVQVEIQGFFTERFLNLCRINNIKIWNITNIVTGVVRFSIAIKDFKKLKPIAKKTKCKIKILSKKGVYFKLFKYRKRKLAFLLIVLFICISIFSTTFVWNIEITGNTYISTDNIMASLEEAGLYVGRNKIGLKTKKIINSLRISLSDIAWVGIDIDGTNAYVEIVEKTRLEDESTLENSIGDIISDKSGIIEKLIVESGTPILSVGDYVESGRILIEGRTYSEYLGTQDVTAKGTIILKTQYEYTNDYYYITNEKEYTGKIRYSIGFTINNNEFYINYLDKSQNYDIIKSGKEFKIFGNTIEFDTYEFDIYNVVQKTVTKEEILEIALENAQEYFDDIILPDLKNAEISNTDLIIIEETNEKISIKVVFEVLEEVGYFKERT